MGVILQVQKDVLEANARGQDIQKVMAPAAMAEHGKGHAIITAIGEAGSVRRGAMEAMEEAMNQMQIQTLKSVHALTGKQGVQVHYTSHVQAANGRMQEQTVTVME